MTDISQDRQKLEDMKKELKQLQDEYAGDPKAQKMATEIQIQLETYEKIIQAREKMKELLPGFFM